jgi:hypothetical protein
MKRFVVALAVLLASYGLSRADYVIIIYNVAPTPEKPAGGGFGIQGGAGMIGFPGGGGMAGMGGLQPPGGGMAGMGGLQPPGGGMAGMGGLQPPGGGMAGMGGLQPPGGGMAGMGGLQPPGGGGNVGFRGGSGPPGGGGSGPPGGMGGSRPPGGMGGMQPPGGAGGMQPPGGGAGGLQPGGFGGGAGGSGPPGGGGAGAIGFGGGAMGLGGFGIGGFFGGAGGPAQPEQNLTPLLAVAVVEVDRVRPIGGGIIHALHKWSPRNGSSIVPTTPDKHITVQSMLNKPSVKKRYELQVKAKHLGGKPTPNGLLELAQWALGHGMIDEFIKNMNELAVLEPNNEYVAAYQQVQKAMAKPITKADPADDWKARVLDGYHLEKSEHYGLWHNLEAGQLTRPAEVDSRLKRLEANYQAFFYWFALNRVVLPVPEQRLHAVLIKEGGEFKRQQQIFDSLPTVADGFLARRDNLAVFSLERTDLASEALARNTKSLWQEVATSRDESLKNRPLAIVNGKRTALPPEAEAEIQTIALLERALQEDAEIASVTHEGTRQLLAATGQLPRNVAVPEWLQFGWAAFFETPKGSAWMTVGKPSAAIIGEFNYLGQYKAADKAGRLEKQRSQTLIKVVTDSYFHEMALNPKSEDARIKARTLSWALVSFLANQKLESLRRYHEELKRLPRDLEFDPETLMLAFARAFDCLDTSRPNTVDRNKLEKLANNWHDYIVMSPAEDESLLQELTKAQNELKTRQGNKP